MRTTIIRREAFALVITLIMLTLAAVLAVTLLSNASLDRSTTTSFNYRYDAELAAQSALEASKNALLASPTAAAATISDDSFLVLRAEGTQSATSTGIKDTYYYMAKAQAGSGGKVDCYPLFSGGTPISLTINSGTPFSVQKPTAPSTAFSDPAQETFGSTVKQYPQLYSSLRIPFTQWQEIRDPTDPGTGAHTRPYQRYTWWVEDMSGYLDAGVAGNTNSSGSHQRDNGTNPNEVALFTIFDPNLQNDSGSTSAKNLITQRAALFTVPTLKQLAPPAGAGKDLTEPNLGVRFGTDVGGEQDLVPRGYAYPNEGSPKKNLNDLIRAKKVDDIAAAITAALPNFVNRRGGNTFDYNKNLAANIIDYADSNGAPTTDESTYRGIGAYPFFVSSYDLNNWVSKSSSPPYTVTIEVTTYVQIWNPHNVSVTGNLMVQYNNVDALTVNGNTVNYTAPPDYAKSVTLSPNQYQVLTLPVKTYTFDWGPTPPASNASIPFPGTTVNNFKIKWNSKLVDRTYKNVQRSGATVGMKYNGANPKSSSNWVWRGNAAPPIYPNLGAPGDARISYYLTKPWTVANYDTNSSWGGRLWLPGSPGVEMQPTQWPDGGHDSSKGYNPSNSVTPDNAAKNATITAGDGEKWVSRLSTKNSLDTMAELGNVFDPGQWNYSIPTTSSKTGLPDIPVTAVADAAAGGGYSLAIGRPEFTLFDKAGQRAWQLLDIFTLAPRRVTSGLINVNTASFEALRALAAGILHNRDNAASASPLYPPTAAQATTNEDPSRSAGAQADLFAQAIIDSRPFLSTGQLQTATNSIGPFFGNWQQWKDATQKPTEWNDSGREELFSKMLNLTTVRSRNFRVFVTGQALDKTGKVLSTVNKVYQVFLQPTRNTGDGAIQTQKAEIRYEATL